MDKYITLAIHTYGVAVSLKDLLEHNGIAVQLENVDIDNPAPSAGVRVRIPESSLPHALIIVEQRVADWRDSALAAEGYKDKILIPLDFSEASLGICRTAFIFAAKLKLHPVLMHVYATPYYDGSLSLTDTFTVDMRDAQVRRDLESAAKTAMRRFCQTLDKAMDDGDMPKLKYSTEISEGVPEEAILAYARQANPSLVVMSTRDAAKKAKELLGSVAAEVLDNCRVPVFTLPDSFALHDLTALSKAVFFCNMDQQDMLAMDEFLALFEDTKLDICLVPVSDKAGSKLRGRLDAFIRYFEEHYPLCRFRYEILDTANLRPAFETLVERDGIELLVVPNKKKNIFARLFSPGIAHRVLFEGDIPMLALPV